MSPSSIIERKPEQQLYQEFLSKETPWVLIITGQGCNGKTKLLHQLAEQTPSDVCVATLNFGLESLRTDAMRVLEVLAWQVRSFCKAQKYDNFKNVLEYCHRQLGGSPKQYVQMIQVGNDAKL